MEVQIIAVWDLEKLLEQTNALLIDLREKEDYEKGHIKGAMHMVYEDIFYEAKQFQKNRPLVLYCERGNASLLAGKILGEMGFVTYTILGGYQAYCMKNSGK